MVFSDLFFLFVFLPAFILIYSLCAMIDRRTERRRGLHRPVHTMKNAALVLFSLLFYSWGEPVYVFLMVISVVINYYTARFMTRSEGKRRRDWLIAGLILDLGILATFKYLGFFATILNDLGLRAPVPQIALPIGISFYIFQSVSYLVDVYRNDSPAQERYSDLLLYISMFPQLIAGPIVRYGTVAHEINNRRVSVSDLADGSFRFLIGLAKKVIIANQFSEIADQFLKNGIDSLSTGGAWVGILAFAFQIYFDFSGYSDMAIGIGRCLGFHFLENFNHPYCCSSVTDFWRRWHMSLGSFFRDYVYIPLGGNRRHQYLNILCVWFLTGMWHGASWNFILWGLFFAAVLVIEKTALLPNSRYIPRPLMHLYALAAVLIGWGIFYFEDLGQMGTFYSALFGSAAEPTGFEVESAIFDRFWLWISAILFCMPVRSVISSIPGRLFPHNTSMQGTLSLGTQVLMSLFILLVSVAMLVGATNNAFLYTRF